MTKNLIKILLLCGCFMAMAAQASPLRFSEYWCGPTVGCGGQSQDFSDINPKANLVMVAFALVDAQGMPSFELNGNMTPDQFKQAVKQLQTASTPKKVILSVGGQGAYWQGALDHPQTFTQGIATIINTYHFDGVDLDIEGSSLATSDQAQQLIQLIASLRQQFKQTTDRNLLITVTPECTTVVNTVPTIGGGWNTMVPVINQAINNIDFIQVQAYNNNPYGDTAGSATFFENIYKNWIAPFPTTNPVKYNGMPASKLLLGVPASSTAANQAYYPSPAVLTQVLQDLTQEYSDFGGIMTWDSHWDALNSYAVSNLVTQFSQ
jgi:chitinase